MSEQAYVLAERLGLPVWCEDEAGPSQTLPHPGASGLEERLPATHDQH